jgi:hypothetical protein
VVPAPWKDKYRVQSKRETKYLKIDADFISESEIKSMQSLKQALLGRITSVSQTQSIYCVKAVSKYIIQVSRISSSSSEEFITCYLKKTQFPIIHQKMQRLFS